MFTFLIFSEVYYHLCNNRCGGVNGRLNCQTESKISAADKMGGGKLNPTMKKNFLSQILWNTSKKLFFLFFIFYFYESANGRPVKKKPKGSVMYMLAWIWVFITLLIRRSFTFKFVIMKCLRLIFFNMQMILRSSILKARATLLTKIYDLAIRNHQTKRTDISQYEQMVHVVKCVALRS